MFILQLSRMAFLRSSQRVKTPSAKRASNDEPLPASSKRRRRIPAGIRKRGGSLCERIEADIHGLEEVDEALSWSSADEL